MTFSDLSGVENAVSEPAERGLPDGAGRSARRRLHLVRPDAAGQDSGVDESHSGT